MAGTAILIGLAVALRIGGGFWMGKSVPSLGLPVRLFTFF